MTPRPPVGPDTLRSGSVAGTDPENPRVILVLAHRPDPTAERLVALLQRLTDPQSDDPCTRIPQASIPTRDGRIPTTGAARAELVFLDQIATSTSFQHRLDGSICRTSVQLRDGRKWSDSDLAVVVNRLQFADVPHFVRARSGDREYAVMEFFALLISWLSGLTCTVIQPPSAQALHGRLLSPVAWQSLAARAGLAVPRLRIVTRSRQFPSPRLTGQIMKPIPGGPALLGLDLPDIDPELGTDQPLFLGDALGTDSRTILVLGDEILGDLPDELADPCRRLARLSGHTVLRIHFSNRPDRNAWLFTGAEPVPTLSTSTEIAAMARLTLQKVINPCIP